MLLDERFSIYITWKKKTNYKKTNTTTRNLKYQL